ncbi:hypothetical protein UC34_16225 [Pandoraea vervacti]|uniref:Ku domain-containing protein n=1 Tax=Pandoraea vervacti TaxID=656178 RepID=A0ABM5SZS8_9BURK|nr:hypothetical protein [Pandoraea vervacti]AJP58097.1 hypothetical protein UC34_16225 [Pandoraea vervacti]
MSAEQKTLHRGFTIITVLERLSKGRARLSAKVIASDEDHKRRLGGKKLLQAKRWFDHFADDLAAPVIAGLKHTIDLELAAAAKAGTTPAVGAKSPKAGKVAKVEKSAKAGKGAGKGTEKGAEKHAQKREEKHAEKDAKALKGEKAKSSIDAMKTAASTKALNGAMAGTANGAAPGGSSRVSIAARKRAKLATKPLRAEGRKPVRTASSRIVTKSA